MAKRPYKKDNTDSWIAGIGAGCLGFFILIKLALIAFVVWGGYELITWITSK